MNIYIPTPEIEVLCEVKMKIGGRAQALVVDPRTKQVIERHPWSNNLILNSGLDMFASKTNGLTGCFRYAAAGYGTSVAANGQTTLDSERTAGADVDSPVRSVTYLTGAGNCGTTHVGGSGLYTHRLTHDFSEQLTPQTYAEVGYSDNPARDSTLFSRIKLAGSVGVNAGQQLRTVYDLGVTYSPVTVTANTPTITGWTTDGDHCLQEASIWTLDTTGSQVENNGGVLEPGAFRSSGLTAHNWFVSDVNTAPTIYEAGGYPNRLVGSSNVNYFQKAVALSTYNNGDYYREKVTTFDASEALIAAGISAIGIGLGANAGNTLQAWAHVFDDPQPKVNTHRLILRFRLTWDRV